MQPVRIRPERVTLTVVVVLLLGTLPLALTGPWTSPLLLVPVAALVWVLRARVIATTAGLEVCNGLLVRRVPWTDVAAFDVPKRGPVVLRTTAGRRLRLLALNRRDLPRVLEVGTPA